MQSVAGEGRDVRPSPSAPRPTRAAARVLVVSANAARRERWARAVIHMGCAPIRCVGPLVCCALIERGCCPLLAEADLALYDRESFTPTFARVLAAKGNVGRRVFIARDGADGGPVAFRHALPAASDACFGDPHLGSRR